MPLAAWVGSKDTVHRYLQIVGKIRLAHAPRRNHWWHVPFHLTSRGITTRPMQTDPIHSVDFDFVDHRLVVATVEGRTESFALGGNTVASFYHRTLAALEDVGVDVLIEQPYPFDLADGIPFADDDRPREYDPVWVNRYWRVLGEAALLLEQFAGEFSGKTSPVHHFWHTMDLAVTRFSDRPVDHPASADSVTKEAYSSEVVSFGFWFGDDSFPEPAFYSYTAPEPPGLAERPLAPTSAEWLERSEGHLAVYRYDDARAAPDPRAAVLAFLESTYQAGAGAADWDLGRWASPGGSTTRD